MNQSFRTTIKNYEYIVNWHPAKKTGKVVVDSMVRDTLRFIDTTNYGVLTTECGSIKGFALYRGAVASSQITTDGITPERYLTDIEYGLAYLDIPNEEAIASFLGYMFGSKKCHYRLTKMLSKHSLGKLSNKNLYIGFMSHIRTSWQEYYQYQEGSKERGELLSLFSKPDLVEIKKRICDRYREFDIQSKLDLARQRYECSVWNCQTEEEEVRIYSDRFSLYEARVEFQNHKVIRQYIGSPLHIIEVQLAEPILIQSCDYIKTTG